jgi:hypothetical protein
VHFVAIGDVEAADDGDGATGHCDDFIPMPRFGALEAYDVI